MANKGPAPPGSTRRPRTIEDAREPDPEATTNRIVELLNGVTLTFDQAERIASVAAMHANGRRLTATRREHVLAMIDNATISRDEAKLIAIRALRRAQDLEGVRTGPL